jgi:hypothetical protein
MPRDLGGRPEFRPTAEQRKYVQILAGLQVPHQQIARMIGDGIHEQTMRKHFAVELQNGKDALVASLKTMVVKAAQNGSVRAQTWLLERLAGPEFAPQMRIGGIDGASPIPVATETQVSIYLPDNNRTLTIVDDGMSRIDG